MKCPQCDHEVILSGSVPCLCDKDFCTGQRCGANDLFYNYRCPACEATGTPEDTQNYINHH
jgi:hypothetical protein